MEKTQKPGGLENSLGITSTTLSSKPLDNTYLESLFAADPDQVAALDTEVTSPQAEEPSTMQPPAANGKKQQAANDSTSSAFIVEDPDFVAGLQEDAAMEPTADTQPEQQEPAVVQQDNKATPAPGEETVSRPDASPILDQHMADFVQELFQAEILTREEDEEISITSPQALIERFNLEKQKGAVQILENILSHYGKEYREAFNAIYINGVHPRDYFVQSVALENLTELDLSRVENQKYVLSTYYKTLGWDTAKISAKIEKLENYQDLEEEARDIHTTLLAREKQELATMEQRQKEELSRKAALEQEYQAGVARILKEKLKARELDGIPLDEKTVRELSDYMLQKKWQLGEQQISDYEKDILDLTRPENRELQIKVALLLHLLKTDPTLSRLQRKAITTQTNQMFSFLQREASTAKKQGKKTTGFFDD